MTTAFASIEIDQSRLVDGPWRRERAHAMSEIPLTRATTGGPFSLFDDAALKIAAEKGLVIRVRSGCLWVPGRDEHCSIDVGEGDQFVCRQDGTLRVRGCRGTEVEVEWPAHNGSSISAH